MIEPDEPLEAMLEHRFGAGESGEKVLARFLEAAVAELAAASRHPRRHPAAGRVERALAAGLAAVLVEDGPAPQEVVDEAIRRRGGYA